MDFIIMAEVVVVGLTGNNGWSNETATLARGYRRSRQQVSFTNTSKSGALARANQSGCKNMLSPSVEQT